jgi:hypothetical protein
MLNGLLFVMTITKTFNHLIFPHDTYLYRDTDKNINLIRILTVINIKLFMG